MEEDIWIIPAESQLQAEYLFELKHGYTCKKCYKFEVNPNLYLMVMEVPIGTNNN